MIHRLADGMRSPLAIVLLAIAIGIGAGVANYWSWAYEDVPENSFEKLPSTYERAPEATPFPAGGCPDLLISFLDSPGCWREVTHQRLRTDGIRHGPRWDDAGFALAVTVIAYFLLVGFVLSARAISSPRRR